MTYLEQIKHALAQVDESETLKLITEALQEQLAPTDILKVCQEGMVEVGNQFECGEYFVSELMMSGEIFKQISSLLEPHLKGWDTQAVGKVVMGTVQGDMHNIGKDIVVTMLKTANLEVIDLGVDVRPERFVAALKESGAAVLGMSGLLTLAFDAMKETIAEITAAGLRDRVKIMIGGGMVDAGVCKVVGADNWGTDAMQAIRIAQQFLSTANMEAQNA